VQIWNTDCVGSGKLTTMKVIEKPFPTVATRAWIGSHDVSGEFQRVQRRVAAYASDEGLFRERVEFASGEGVVRCKRPMNTELG
jgi:hypothetical protein